MGFVSGILADGGHLALAGGIGIAPAPTSAGHCLHEVEARDVLTLQALPLLRFGQELTGG